jgi:hypothetical protein
MNDKPCDSTTPVTVKRRIPISMSGVLYVILACVMRNPTP